MIIKQNQDEIQGYLEDASNFRSGSAEALYVPKNEAEIVQAIVECSREKIPLTINGGGTGTVAGRIPMGGRILTVEKLDRILSVEPERKRSSLQAGGIVDNFLKIRMIYRLPGILKKFGNATTAFVISRITDSVII